MRAEAVIRVEGLHKSFRRGPEVIHVLKGLELEVGTGEGVAVMRSLKATLDPLKLMNPGKIFTLPD